MKHSEFATLEPRIVLGVGAHPDDMDFLAGGSMAKWAASGAEVYYLVLTDGSKGTQDRDLAPARLITMRRTEQHAAGKKIGLKGVTHLDYPDGMLENTLDVRRDVVKEIRRLLPDVVVAMDPSMLYSLRMSAINHPDHRAAGQAALDAVFPMARDHLSFAELLDEGLEPHKVRTVLLTNYDRDNFAVDISDTFETKLQAMKEHKSQLAGITGFETILGDMASRVGAEYGCQRAEAFVRIDIS